MAIQTCIIIIIYTGIISAVPKTERSGWCAGRPGSMGKCWLNRRYTQSHTSVLLATRHGSHTPSLLQKRVPSVSIQRHTLYRCKLVQQTSQWPSSTSVAIQTAITDGKNKQYHYLYTSTVSVKHADQSKLFNFLGVGWDETCTSVINIHQSYNIYTPRGCIMQD